MVHITNRRLPQPTDPWDTRFGFFWYNDEEIFHDSQADLNRKAEIMADAGINHVITFSCTHFRWSFRRYWPLLNETLRKIVHACHQHGIYVTEHHSSHLTFNPKNEADEYHMDRILRVRKSTRNSWPKLREDCDADPIIIDGVHLSELRQIDGRTGRPVFTGYHGHAMCFNNPFYRKAYFQYLESVYATGVDGIMTDDVQWFAIEWSRGSHACTCPYCQQKFLEKTGYTLPKPDEWNTFFWNYDE